MSSFLEHMLRAVVPLAVGYVLAWRMGFSAEPLRVLLRWVFLPVALFMVLLSAPSDRSFVIPAVYGVATALAGYWIGRLGERYGRVSLPRSSATPALWTLVLPWLVLAMSSRPSTLGAAAVVFVFASLALTLSELGEKGFSALIREPWVTAALLALVWRLGGIHVDVIRRVASPLSEATWVVALVYVGAKLFPLPSLKHTNVSLGALARLGAGLGVALLAVWLVRMPESIATALIACGLAPAATMSVALYRSASDRDDDRATFVASTLVSVVGLGVWQAFF